MHIVTLTAPVFATNCYLVSATGTGPCVIIDAGGGVAPAVEAELAARGLEPALILATHGHVDHTWSSAQLSRTYDVDLRLHSADSYRLSDPFGSLEHTPRGGTGTGGSAAGGRIGGEPGERQVAGQPGGLRAALASGPLGQALAASGCAPQDYEAPSAVETFDLARQTWQVAGLEITAIHAPGHTEGSTLYVIDAAPAANSVLPGHGGVLTSGATATAFTGDVLFAGTIGRTDLPGGDGETMARTLIDVVSMLDPGTLVLPGHGPASRMREELASNPYLARR